MKRLTELANKYQTDKGTEFAEAHGFTEFYEPYWLNYMDKEDLTILEIGVYWGSSLKMINEFFNGKCEIYGIDINFSDCCEFDEENIHVHVCNQGSEKSIKKFLKDIGEKKFDIIIDDGSHEYSDQMTSLYYFKDYVKEGGIYIIEDLHTSLVNGDIGNSTLFFLNFAENVDSLTPEQNEEIKKKIDYILIFNRNNPRDFANDRSITSIIKFLN